jgi:hypothetical protein
MNTYDHLLHIDEGTRELHIYRVDDAGSKSFYTSIPLPQSLGWNSDLESFAKRLGENLLVDSPTARKLLGL